MPPPADARSAKKLYLATVWCKLAQCENGRRPASCRSLAPIPEKGFRTQRRAGAARGNTKLHFSFDEFAFGQFGGSFINKRVSFFLYFVCFWGPLWNPFIERTKKRSGGCTLSACYAVFVWFETGWLNCHISLWLHNFNVMISFFEKLIMQNVFEGIGRRVYFFFCLSCFVLVACFSILRRQFVVTENIVFDTH